MERPDKLSCCQAGAISGETGEGRRRRRIKLYMATGARLLDQSNTPGKVVHKSDVGPAPRSADDHQDEGQGEVYRSKNSLLFIPSPPPPPLINSTTTRQMEVNSD